MTTLKAQVEELVGEVVLIEGSIGFMVVLVACGEAIGVGLDEEGALCDVLRENGQCAYFEALAG